MVGFFLLPGEAVAKPELVLEALTEGEEVFDVGGGVGELGAGKGSAHPVAPGLPLVEAEAEEGPDEDVIGGGIALADEAGGDLDVEDVGGEGAGGVPAEAGFLVAGVDDEGDGGVGGEAPEGREVGEGEGVDDRDVAGGGDLDQGEFGAVGAFADELRVDGEEAGVLDVVAEAVEGVWGGEEGGVGGGHGREEGSGGVRGCGVVRWGGIVRGAAAGEEAW